jgi:4-hydroxy-tetrahydrodipicolinate synthase
MFRLEGIIPPMVTPFKANEEVDEEALRAEVGHLLDEGVHGITVCGSTGEGYAMTSEEIGLVTAIAREEIRGRVPLITGIITDSAWMALRHGKAAKDGGADALMVTPVHYVFQPTERGTIEYYRRIGEALGLPIVIYNVVPWANISSKLAVRLTRIRQVQGIKQSGGDIHGLADMIRDVGDRVPVLTAIDDMLFPSFLIGARGAIAAICTIAPQLCVELWEAAKKGDVKVGAEIHHRLLPVWRAVGRGDMPARAKEALSQLGRPVGIARSPLIPVDDGAKREIRRALLEAGLLKR